MRFSALREYHEEEMWVLNFPHHKLEKFFKSRVEDEWFGKTFLASVMWKTQYLHFRPHCIHIYTSYKYTKKPVKWANCLKIREVFTTTCDGIDFYQQKWGYWKISPLRSSVAFNNENSLKFCRYWQNELQTPKPNWHYQK